MKTSTRPLSRLLQLFCKESLKVCTKISDTDRTLQEDFKYAAGLVFLRGRCKVRKRGVKSGLLFGLHRWIMVVGLLKLFTEMRKRSTGWRRKYRDIFGAHQDWHASNTSNWDVKLK